MSKVFGTNDSLIMDDNVDSDGELEIMMPVYASDFDSESVTTWIDREGAIKIMEHLQNVFGI